MAEIIRDVYCYTNLDGVSDTTISEIDGRTYALVVASADNGVQIIDITDPGSPVAVTDDENGFTELDGANSVAVSEIDGRTYALVVALGGDGVQIIVITVPTNPTTTAVITDGAVGLRSWPGA